LFHWTLPELTPGLPLEEAIPCAPEEHIKYKKWASVKYQRVAGGID
jgi:hypothetical protein